MSNSGGSQSATSKSLSSSNDEKAKKISDEVKISDSDQPAFGLRTRDSRIANIIEVEDSSELADSYDSKVRQEFESRSK